MTLYVRTTADEYELPIAVAESPKELAQMLGIKVESVHRRFWRAHPTPHWYKVEVEEDEH